MKSAVEVAGEWALYEGCAVVTNVTRHFLILRDTALLHKESPKLTGQPNTHLEGSEVLLLEYEASALLETINSQWLIFHTS